MRRIERLAAVAVVLMAGGARVAEATPSWPTYLDYAHVYVSSHGAPLAERLDQYAAETGTSLDDYLAALDSRSPTATADARRRAVGALLLYLRDGEPRALAQAAAAARRLKTPAARREELYWAHTILAHEALERGRADAFVAHAFALWRDAIAPLEAPYATLAPLSLHEEGGAGFVSALPYLYENLTRLILIRSQERGLDRGLDPLAALVRMLDDPGRVGGHPDVIPRSASSRAYLTRVVQRLNGPESDGGSLTFTLLLLEAAQRHAEARAELAADGLSPRAREATRRASSAYTRALARARTTQGQVAVYTRALRQLGELYAVHQRAGEAPGVEVPFTLERAATLFEHLHARREHGLESGGYGPHGTAAVDQALRDLWHEIQETGFNAVDAYRAAAIDAGPGADALWQQIARTCSLYLRLFDRHARSNGSAAVPDSATFGAYEAHSGLAAALLASRNPDAQREATRHALAAARLFPFGRSAWTEIARTLEAQGRESEYLPLVRALTTSIVDSRVIEAWLDAPGASAPALRDWREALADELTLLHLGFADSNRIGALTERLRSLETRRAEVAAELSTLQTARERRNARVRIPGLVDPPTALPAVASLGGQPEAPGIEDRSQELRELGARLDAQIDARARALPRFQRLAEAAALEDPLRGDRGHALHSLLRRLEIEQSTSATTRP
ncbi:MAG: hypothetical protein MJE66_05590 [Proteobacteria bacterium]|nr:hypothetical protein [Pseudomonadota bacterium]